MSIMSSYMMISKTYVYTTIINPMTQVMSSGYKYPKYNDSFMTERII